MIVLLVEGATETALKGALKRFLDARAKALGRPKVALRTKTLLTQGGLQRRIKQELRDPKVTAVVGLIDVYPNFKSAAQAKAFLRKKANNDPRFYAHVAQYDVEAWLLPFWDDICKRLKVKRARPGTKPEQVNHHKPPSKRLAELYRIKRRKYKKPIEMAAILKNKDLTIIANQCPEFKAFLNTLLTLSNLPPL